MMSPIRMLKTLDSHTIQFSILLYFGMAIPVSLVHESGHALVCLQAGHESSTHMNFRGMYSTCQPDLETTAFYITGPVIGAITSVFSIFCGSMLKISSKKVITAALASSLIIVGIAYVADQVSKIVLEGFMTVLYEKGAFDVAITIFQIIALIVPLVIFAKRDRVFSKMVRGTVKS